MAFCTTRSPRKPGAAPVPPTKPNGTCYEWGIRLPGDSHIGWADTVVEIVGLLVGEPAYEDMTPQDQAYHRILRAIRLQVVTQARINFLAQTVLADWDDACEWEREVLNGPRHVQPHGFESAPLFAGRDVWTCPIPLVLVATGFEPYSDLPHVEGPEDAVWWIDPSTDESFLDTLAQEPLGLIQVWHLAR